MDWSNVLFGLFVYGIKKAAAKSEAENPDNSTFIGALANSIDRIESQTGINNPEYKRSYVECRQRYMSMTEEELNHEIARIKANSDKGYKRAGAVNAMRDEIKHRHGEEDD